MKNPPLNTKSWLKSTFEAPKILSKPIQQWSHGAFHVHIFYVSKSLWNKIHIEVYKGVLRKNKAISIKAI